MATAAPRPPPTSPLPQLPVPKIRKPLSETGASGPTRASLTPSNLPTSNNVRSLSSSTIPTLSQVFKAQVSESDASHPTSDSSRSATGPRRTLRKTISIGSFPQPPRSNASSSPGIGTPPLNHPKSPLCNSSTPTDGAPPATSLARTPSDSRSIPRSIGPLRRDHNHAQLDSVDESRPSTSGTIESRSRGRSSRISEGGRKSLGGMSIRAPATWKGSLGPPLPSPPTSRGTSPVGSISTDRTAFEDLGDEPAMRAPPEQKAATAAADSERKDGKGNVIVSVRVRPDASGEVRVDGDWTVDGRKSLVSFRGREAGDYFYDNVFTTLDNNARVYDAAAKRLVRRVMEGYHGTVFAYGMTGTGKTFSMQGTANSPGVIPLAITDIFSFIRETPHREFLLRVSYLEIYNEKIHDLLSAPVTNEKGAMAPPPQEEIKLREDSRRGVYATPLKEEIVQSPTQLLRVIARGDNARRTGSTQFNARSSRSHAVVQIVVESRERTPGTNPMQEKGKRPAVAPGGVRVSTLSLIDLAGSERAAENKERRTEGAHINKSLLTLGTVIARLSGDKDKQGNGSDKDGKHLPYRDSKLTRLLQPALQGNSLVSILCTIQIASSGSATATNTHVSETLNTLKFASRAKNNIVSHAKRAEDSIATGGDEGSRALLDRYRLEIQGLRKQLDAQTKVNEEVSTALAIAADTEAEKAREASSVLRHEEQLLEMQLARTALKERIEHLNRLILSSKSLGVNSSRSFSSLSMQRRDGGPPFRLELQTRSSRSSAVSQLEPASPRPGLQSRRTSNGIGHLATLRTNSSDAAQSPVPETPSSEVDSLGSNGDGTASSAAQIRALQADLADKNRYISTLEKRLLQARRTSRSRVSMSFNLPHSSVSGTNDNDGAPEGFKEALREKDAEIAELKARLEDKERMVTALRSAARNRDVADIALDNVHSETSSRRRSSRRSSHHQPVGSTEVKKPVMSPVQLLNSPEKHSRGIEDMTRILDEMIQGRASLDDSAGLGLLSPEKPRPTNVKPWKMTKVERGRKRDSILQEGGRTNGNEVHGAHVDL